MTNEETAQCVAFINSSWGNKPLDQVASRTWGAELRPYPFDRVLEVLRSLLRTEDWRPSLRTILRELTPFEIPNPSEAFEKVWAQIGKRDREVTAIEAETVRRLGGWHQLGMWEIAKRHWHAKAFAEVYQAAAESTHADVLRAIAAGERPPQLASGQPALEGEAHRDIKPDNGGDLVSPDRVDELVAGFAGRARG